MKWGLSVRTCVRACVRTYATLFLRNRSLLFSETFHDIKVPQGLESDEDIFFRKFLFPWKRGQKDDFGPKMTVFRIFSETVHYFFLKLFVMFKYYKGYKLAWPFILGKFLFPWKRGQKDNFGPKMTVFRIFSETVHYFFLKLFIMFKYYKSYKLAWPFILGKFLFPWKRGQKDNFGSKLTVFRIFSETVHTFFLEPSIMFKYHKG